MPNLPLPPDDLAQTGKALASPMQYPRTLGEEIGAAVVGLPSALVCLLYAGEPSLANAIRSIEKQRGVDVRFILIGNHPKRLAHERLFKTLNMFRDEHDVTLFLGADMELVPDRLLAALAGTYRQFPSIDHAILGVDDWFSGEQILGVQSWRRGVRHATDPNRLFTDVVANSSRGKFKLAHPRTPLILHGEEPSNAQAIRYGAQRAMKAAASGKASRWDRLATFARSVTEEPHPKRLLALAAMDVALEDPEFGLRCISGDDPLNASDLSVLHRRAESGDLVQSLSEKVNDSALRLSLSRERSESPADRGRPRLKYLSKVANFSSVRSDPPPQESIEAAFYEFLAADETPV